MFLRGNVRTHENAYLERLVALVEDQSQNEARYDQERQDAVRCPVAEKSPVSVHFVVFEIIRRFVFGHLNVENKRSASRVMRFTSEIGKV